MRISDWSSDVCSSDLVDYQRRQETNEIFIPPGERLGSKAIEFNNVSKSFGDRLLIDNLSFIAPPGAIIGIIGPNGDGQPTLFKMIKRKEKPDSGNIDRGPIAKHAYLAQIRRKPDGKQKEIRTKAWRARKGKSRSN